MANKDEKKIKELADRAGLALRTMTKYRDRYEEIRNEIKEMYDVKDNEMMNRWIQGSAYEASYSYDEHEKIDPIKFLDEIKSKSLRRQLLQVPITKARAVPEVKRLLTKIASKTADEEPTLHIRQIDPEREAKLRQRLKKK